MFFEKSNRNQIGDFRKQGNRFYKTKQYSNPYFPKVKNKKRSGSMVFFDYTIAKFYLLGFLGISIFLLWFFFYSSFFEIKNIAVSEGGRVSSSEIEYLAWQQINESYFKFLPQKNIFIFSSDKLKAKLEEKYFFEELSVSKKAPRDIIIQFIEKEYAIIWKEGERYYYCDENGEKIIEIENILEINQKDYPVIENDSNNFEKRTKDEQEKITYIMKLFREFKSYREVFEIEKFVINNDLNSITIILIDGPKLYFNSKEDAVKQINKVIIIKDEKLKDSFNTRQYIDVRIGDSVYYR